MVAFGLCSLIPNIPPPHLLLILWEEPLTRKTTRPLTPLPFGILREVLDSYQLPVELPLLNELSSALINLLCEIIILADLVLPNELSFVQICYRFVQTVHMFVFYT